MMANTRGHDTSTRLIEQTCCKCSKSEEKMVKRQLGGSPYLDNAVSKLEERRSGLVIRQQYLRQKITTMERSIPALIALNMLKNEANSAADSPLCRVKEMMKKLSPHQDPTDRLLDKLVTTVNSLNGETAELHDKIIAADIKLEESEMELESLQLANKELAERLTSMEKDLNMHKTPSLHSIYSDDLICLTKIRQLGEAEINLKNSIKELEKRENLFHRQMDRIFKSNESRKASCDGLCQKIRQLECNERRIHCDLDSQKFNVQQLKKKMLRTERKHAKTSDVENQATSTKERSDKGAKPAESSNPPSINVTSSNRGKVTTTSRCEALGKSQVACSALPSCYPCINDTSKGLEPSLCSLKFCPASLDSNVSKGQACVSPCKEETSTLVNAPCEIVPPIIIKGKSLITPSTVDATSSCRRQASCSTGTLCSKCQGLKICKQYPQPRNPNTDCTLCTCKGKCTTGATGIMCNCALIYLNSVDKEANEQTSTDEEYCECCDCSCDADSESADTT